MPVRMDLGCWLGKLSVITVEFIHRSLDFRKVEMQLTVRVCTRRVCAGLKVFMRGNFYIYPIGVKKDAGPI